jgi:nucleoside-diphosphate-sugar epimerase
MTSTPCILITGAAGHLGSHLIAELLAAGHRLRGFDRVHMPDSPLPPEDCITGDLADREAVEAALKGVDIVMHCASIHPWKQYSDAQHIDANIKGTWTLYSAIAQSGVRKAVLTSSVAATGYSSGLQNRWPVVESDETTPGDIYSYTKQAQEGIAKSFAKSAGVQTIALRPPAFMPRSPEETGLGLLGCYGVVQDIVSAHVAAGKALIDGVQMEPFEAFFVTNELPYTSQDVPLLEDGQVGLKLVGKYWPHTVEWLRANGFTAAWCPAAYDLSKAKRLLGWSPETSFGSWFEQHTQGAGDSA